MKKILFICEEIPALNTNGYSTYNHAFLSTLADEYDVHLIIVGNRFTRLMFKISAITGLNNITTYIPNAIKLTSDIYFTGLMGGIKYFYRKIINQKSFISSRLLGIRKGDGTVLIGRWLSTGERLSLDQIISKISPDVIFVDTLFRTPNIESQTKSCQTVLIGHDVFYQRCKSLIQNGLNPKPNITEVDEARVLQQYDFVIAITELDASSYRELSPTTSIATLSSPITVIREGSKRKSTQHILYIGSQAHHNVDGLLWFVSEVWPLVRQKNQNLVLDVVGGIKSSFNAEVEGMVFHGRLDDYSRISNNSMFAINPVRAGSGMKIKMLDYFAQGLGCITTSVGAAGFPEIEHSPMLISDSAEEFANLIIELSKDSGQMETLSENATQYAGLFSRDKFKASLYEIVNKLL